MVVSADCQDGGITFLQFHKWMNSDAEWATYTRKMMRPKVKPVLRKMLENVHIRGLSEVQIEKFLFTTSPAGLTKGELQNKLDSVLKGGFDRDIDGKDVLESVCDSNDIVSTAEFVAWAKGNDPQAWKLREQMPKAPEVSSHRFISARTWSAPLTTSQKVACGSNLNYHLLWFIAVVLAVEPTGPCDQTGRWTELQVRRADQCLLHLPARPVPRHPMLLQVLLCLLPE